jgi:hypothetical protein
MAVAQHEPDTRSQRPRRRAAFAESLLTNRWLFHQFDTGAGTEPADDQISRRNLDQLSRRFFGSPFVLPG